MTGSTVGQRIAEQRKKLGLSQETLGEKVGVSRQAISKWESDAATPEIDKLIALSRLYGVSVGWLLGVEEQTAQQEASLSEAQLKTVEEIIKKYHPAPAPLISKWQQVLAVCVVVSIFLCLFAMQITNAKQESAIQSKADTSIYNEISARLSVLEAAVLHPSESLLAEYSIDVSPFVSQKDGNKAQILFSAAPSTWVSGDTGYLYIRGTSTDTQKTECSWNGTHLSASVTLPVQNGYELFFVVEHESGIQEQQVLENDTIENLVNVFTIPLSVIPGKFNFKNGVLTLSDYTATLDLPPVYSLFENTVNLPTIAMCEYRLIMDPAEKGAPAITLTDSVVDSITYVPNAPDRIQGRLIQFRDIDIETVNHLQFWFYVKLSNGMENKYLIETFEPTESGELTTIR